MPAPEVDAPIRWSRGWGESVAGGGGGRGTRTSPLDALGAKRIVGFLTYFIIAIGAQLINKLPLRREAERAS